MECPLKEKFEYRKKGIFYKDGKQFDTYGCPGCSFWITGGREFEEVTVYRQDLGRWIRIKECDRWQCTASIGKS